MKLHANATTTPKVRALSQASTGSVAGLVRQFGISGTSVRRWRGRSDVQDRPNTRHDLGQSTTPAEEALIAALRRDLRLSPRRPDRGDAALRQSRPVAQCPLALPAAAGAVGPAAAG